VWPMWNRRNPGCGPLAGLCPRNSASAYWSFRWSCDSHTQKPTTTYARPPPLRRNLSRKCLHNYSYYPTVLHPPLPLPPPNLIRFTVHSSRWPGKILRPMYVPDRPTLMKFIFRSYYNYDHRCSDLSRWISRYLFGYLLSYLDK